MGKPVAGDVVVVPFPFSDLSANKRRPALVLVSLDGEDLILCMITSQRVTDRWAISLEPEDFAVGSLPVSGNIRPARLFTAEHSLVVRVEGRVSGTKMHQVRTALAQLFGEP